MELFQPMEPILTSAIKSEEGWIHQVKWDGIRGISYFDQNSVRIFTKQGRERTGFYPEIRRSAGLLKADHAVLDGEMIVFDEYGRPSFNLALTREKIRTLSRLDYYLRKYPVYYLVFDLLYLNDQDIRHLPYSERSALLRDILRPDERIIATDDYEDGQHLFEIMKERGMEGIVSKRSASIYTGGKKHHDWLKKKINRKMLLVIGGVILKDGYPNSLLLGIYQEGALAYVGRAAVGLTRENVLDLKKHIAKYKSRALQEVSPFENLSHEPGVIWLKPALTCWVQFLEWTASGGLRHPRIIGFSDFGPREALGKEYLV